MAKPRILVIGSFVMDQIASTEVFPREGQTVLGKAFSKAPGGKGANQAVQMARLGADVTLVGKLGRDSNGEEMKKVCDEAGIHTEHILYDEALPSGCSVLILEEHPGQQTVNRIIVLSGSNMSITAEDVAFLKEQIASYDLVVLQLEIPMEINELVAAWAYEAGTPVMLNSAPSAPLSDALLSHLAWISPNEHEAYDMTGIRISHSGADINMEEARAAAKVLQARGVKNVLITLGESGAVLATGQEDFFYSPCAAGISAVDPTAAGDSFVGALCVGLGCGWGYEETLAFANHTAALTVSALGAMPSLPTLEQVEVFLGERTGRVPDTSILKA